LGTVSCARESWLTRRSLTPLRSSRKPNNRSKLRSFMGLFNQLGQFSDGISATAGPLRDILKTRNEYVWTGAHKNAMEEVKKMLTTTPILAPFDPEAKTALE
jgi:hypothetical protein